MPTPGAGTVVTRRAVCTPKRAGGLGLPDLKWLDMALRSRWLWLKHIGASNPWKEFNLQVTQESRVLFEGRSVVGNGEATLFWLDR